MTGGRVVTLVLCTADGTVIGALRPFRVPSPWWSDAAEIVDGARARYGLDVVVLRLLTVDGDDVADGGPATYLAQVPATSDLTGAALTPWPGDPAAEHPLRASYARPGGPQADLEWARGQLSDAGLEVAGDAVQVRTWNLSSIWWLPTDAGRVWLKVVPPFFAHEGAVLAALAGLDPAAVPVLVGHDGPRMLLRDVPGSDRYDATGSELVTMVELLVALQAAWVGRTDQLVAMGLPDWRPDAYLPEVEALLRGGIVDTATLRRLAAVTDTLPARVAEIEACGVPDTLLHGDFHPGNVRGVPPGLRVLDWGDSGVGHPLLDETAFCAGLDGHDRALSRATWDRLWRAAVPGCEPGHAADLLAPVAALRAAVVYQRFLDAIEPAEHVYHRHDPAVWLRRAAELT